MENIESFIKNIKKELDLMGSVETLKNIKPPDVISFGIPSLDKLTGVGGAPRGYVTEIYGSPSSGKTALSLQLVAQAQKQGLKCAYIDVELALNQGLSEQSGVNFETLVVFRPVTGEETFEIVENLAEKGFGIIVVDSVASLSAESELNADYDEQTIGLQARLISRAMRKLIGCIHRNNTALIFVNQIRAKMARMPGAKTTTTSGGMAIPFYAGLRLETVRTSWVTKAEGKIGMMVKIRSEKNKLYRPQLETTIEFIFGSGFNSDKDKINQMVENKELEIIGRTYFKDEEKIGDYNKTLEWLNKLKKNNGNIKKYRR